eukprot:Amastigsp_a676973_61.p2 type:complete len:755 gc:universal Amastigsp_a676973_61:2472-208(-)
MRRSLLSRAADARGAGLVVAAALELARHELFVEAVGGDELLVRALLDNTPLVDDDDKVCVPDRREPMRDDERRAPAGLDHSIDCLLDQMLALRVERRGCLVEEQQPRVEHECPRNRDALPLPAAETHTALADKGVVAVRKRENGLVDVRLLGRAHNVLVAQLCVCTVGNVVADRARKQRRVLRNNADRAPQPAEVQLAHIDAVDENRARVDVVEPQNRAHDSALAAAAWAHNSNHLPGAERQRKVVEDLDIGPRRVREANVAQFDRAGDAARKSRCAAFDRDQRLAVEQLKDALRGAHRLHHLPKERCQRGKIDADRECVQQERGQKTRRDRALDHLEPANVEHRQDRQFGRKRHSEDEPAVDDRDHAPDLERFCDRRRVALALGVLARERAHGADLGDRLLGRRRCLCQLGLELALVLLQQLSVENRRDRNERDERQREQRQTPRNEKKRHHATHRRHQRPQEHRHVDGGRRLDHLGIGRESAEQLTRARCVKKPGLHAHDCAVDRDANATDQLLSAELKEPSAEPSEHGAHREDHEKLQYCASELASPGLRRRLLDRSDDAPKEQRHEEIDERAEDKEHRRRDNEPRVGASQREQSLHRREPKRRFLLGLRIVALGAARLGRSERVFGVCVDPRVCPVRRRSRAEHLCTDARITNAQLKASNRSQREREQRDGHSLGCPRREQQSCALGFVVKHDRDLCDRKASDSKTPKAQQRNRAKRPSQRDCRRQSERSAQKSRDHNVDAACSHRVGLH